MLTEEGISGVSDPSGLFVSQSAQGVPAAGTCTTVTMEGRRAMVAEIQALVATTGGQVPRRAVSGLDSARVALVLAVVERRGRVRLGAADVYTATVGGMRITEPGADLAVALAVAGAAFDTPLREGTVAIGEVGLTGELRPVPGLARRLAAAARIGFRLAVVPGDSGDLPALDGMQIIPVRHLTEAMRVTRAEQA
jgi:DNA repair protein RadA/Sms